MTINTEQFINAVNTNKIDAVIQYIKDGADVNMIDPSSQKPLIYRACCLGRLEMVELLLQSGAHPNVDCLVSASLLSYADIENFEKIIKALIQYGVNVNGVSDILADRTIRTPLQSLLSDDYAIAKILMDAGADPFTVQPGTSLSAIDYHIKEGNDDLVDYINRYMATLKLNDTVHRLNANLSLPNIANGNKQEKTIL